MNLPILSSKELNDISKQLVENFSDLQFFFNLDLVETDSCYKGCCPIHEDADNPSGFTIYKDTGAWICHTHGCHEIFHGTTLGLVRGIMSAQKLGWTNECDRTKVFSFPETINFSKQFLAKRPKNPIDSAERHVKNKPKAKKYEVVLNIPKSKFLESIECPAEYFINRGFSEEILKKNMVGLYTKKYRPLSGRVLVPVFNDDGDRIIGCTARTLYDKCLVCSGFHDPRDYCPDKNEPWHFQKWKHNKGFIRTNYLYNFWNAKDAIKKTGKAILVEGPLETWRLEESGIHNSLAIFGSNITEMQMRKLIALKPRLITTIMDSDEGGQSAEFSCANMLKKIGMSSKIKLQHFSPPKNDLGEMSPEEVKSWFAIK